MAKATGLDFAVRPATEVDAKAIVSVLKRSIVEVCGPYYGNDLSLLEKWCQNKTEQNVLVWLNDQTNKMFVAEDLQTKSCVGVGLVNEPNDFAPNAEIHLCYVDPKFINVGVGGALLQAMESTISTKVRTIVVNSTLNAESFYSRYGYVRQTPPSGEPRSVTMSKTFR